MAIEKKLVPLDQMPTERPYTQAWPRKSPWPVFIGSRQEAYRPFQQTAPDWDIRSERMVDDYPPVSAKTRAMLAIALPFPPTDEEAARWLAHNKQVAAHIERWENELRRRFWSLSHIADNDEETCLRCGFGSRHIGKDIRELHEALIWTCASCQAQIVGYARSIALNKGLGVRQVIEDLLMRERMTKTYRPSMGPRLGQ